MRHSALAALLLVTVAPTIGGCAARQAFLERVAAKKQVQTGSANPAAAPRSTTAVVNGESVQLTTLSQLPPPDGTTPAANEGPVSAAAPASAATTTAGTSPSLAAPAGSLAPTMQFLYGSGEASALSYQAYLGLIDLMIAKSSDRGVGQKVASVVLAPGATLAAPKYASCEGKPLAVVFDVDETALLNLGYEADDAQRHAPYDPARWDAWEKTGAKDVVATPGMAEVARVAKASGITLVFNTNRQAANAAQTEAALNGAGLGPVSHGTNLWLQGDNGTGSGKDARRTAIAAKYCVIAMAGDQLGDFSDLFNAPGLSPMARRALTAGNPIKLNWGHGWFVLPNPVYGTALKGGIDDVFPANKRWTPPASTTPSPSGVK